jgi:hypothetical protein
MPDLRRLAHLIRCDSASPGRLFAHRLRVGLVVAGLIFLLSLLR